MHWEHFFEKGEIISSSGMVEVVICEDAVALGAAVWFGELPET